MSWEWRQLLKDSWRIHQMANQCLSCEMRKRKQKMLVMFARILERTAATFLAKNKKQKTQLTLNCRMFPSATK